MMRAYSNSQTGSKVMHNYFNIFLLSWELGIIIMATTLVNALWWLSRQENKFFLGPGGHQTGSSISGLGRKIDTLLGRPGKWKSLRFIEDIIGN